MDKKTFKINYLLDYGIVFVLAAFIVLFSALSSRFFSVSTFTTILKQVSITGIITVGMTLVIMTGGIDLSVGSVAGFSGVLAAYAMVHGVPTGAAVAAALFCGTAAGLMNGLLITYVNIPPFICTLGFMTTLRGAAYLLSGGTPIYGFDPDFKNFAQTSLGILPCPAILMLLIFAAGCFVMQRTALGRYIYGVGGNEEATRLSGVNTHRIKTLVYTVSGLLSSVAGIVLLSRTNSGQPAAGNGYEMDAITAVVLGGVSMNGGSGNMLLVIVGVMIMGILSTGMVMINVNDYVQQVIKGIVLVAAVAFDQLSQKIKQSHASG